LIFYQVKSHYEALETEWKRLNVRGGGQNMMALKIIAGLFIITGFLTVVGSKTIVQKFELDKKIKVEFDGEMTEEEINQYKQLKAAFNVKMAGMLIITPGALMLLLLFK